MDLVPHGPTEGGTLDLKPRDGNINNEEIQMSPQGIAAKDKGQYKQRHRYF